MKRAMLAAFFVLACGCWPGVSAQTSAHTEKEQNLRRLLKLFGGENVGIQAVDVGQMSRMFASLPEETRVKVINFLKEEMRKELSAEKVIELSVPIYAKYLSEGEVKSLVAIYETPELRKFLSVLPLITKEMNQELERAGKEAWEKTMKKLREQGVSNPPAPPQEKPRP